MNIKLKKIYDDSLSCVNGERFSPKGKLKEVSDAIYIGGGTGIADGILYNKKLIDLNMYKNLKKSWEIIMPNGDSIEECMSLAGLCKKWEKRKPISIELLNDLFDIYLDLNNYLIRKKSFMRIIETATKCIGFDIAA